MCLAFAPPLAAACGRSASTTSAGGADAGDSAAAGAVASDGAPLGPSSAYDGEALGSSPSLTEFCRALVAAASRGYVTAHPEACDPVADPADLQYGPQAFCDVMAREVASGHLVFDPSKAAACVAAAQTAGASMSRDVDLPECRAAVAGQLAAGQPCHYGSPLETSVGIPLALGGRPLISACASGLYCAEGPLDASPAAQMCGGVCTAIPKANEPCALTNGCSYCSQPCAQGSVCGSSGNGMLCVPRATEGGECDFSSVEMCEDGLFCSLVVTGSSPYHRVCRPQLSASAPCSDPAYDECAPPNVCYAAPDSDAGASCVAVPILQPGEVCSPSGPAPCACPSVCLDGKCTAVLGAGASPCLMFNTDVLPCRGGTCDGREGDGGTCVANLRPGDPCDPSLPGACGYEACDPTSQRCVPSCFPP
jgi:hypothetical protein